MPFEFGDVLLLPFPFSDQTTVKRRPAVVVSNAVYNSARPDIVVMAVTSQMRSSPDAGETWVQDWRVAGLLKPSSIKPVFATIEQSLVIRRLGTLGEGDRASLKAAIVKLIG